MRDLFGKIGLLELMLCTVVGEEGEEEDHGDLMQGIKKCKNIICDTCGHQTNNSNDYVSREHKNSCYRKSVKDSIVNCAIGHIFH